MSLQKQISLHASTLTHMERKLLTDLLDNREQFDFNTCTIIKIAETFNVSKTSVHRLTQKLGYTNFLYFKNDYFLREQFHEPSIEKNDYVDMLLHTYQAVTEAATEEIIGKMIQCDKITIYGMGMSNFLGKMFQIKLQLLGKTAEQYDDSRFMRLSARALKPESDMLFVLSRSGNPPEVLEAVVEASLRGIDIILITEVPDSPIGNLATQIIYTSHSKDTDADIDTRLNAHIAMDILINKYVQAVTKGT
ncbi:MurR/RpiR family transcriptional regulator [Culicoidibacter larvae]|uniref:MurR/RpiR family transcriptional regulator n=1 Tax=Culicoidibacter larvae TaxID=2579976 RepID=A0A5R8Q9Z3_9FIRM|nr:MurR/RpiR family transcriptional regulator [Culicoidibacter larvae]TLG72744.1 MurR/RpiR family transcriptional regulator [Culicoidibacter larvae]